MKALKLLLSMLCCVGALLPQSLLAQTSRVPMMMTKWGKEVTATNVHPEYPRPTMVRAEWLNLNGLWDYALTRRDQTNTGTFNGKILVPFPVEAPLSGVRFKCGEEQRLWYRRKFSIPEVWHGRRVLLHFEAADWETRIRLNGKELGMHRGGYDRFTFDVTDVLNSAGEQELVVSVFDPTEAGFQPRGKQMLHPHPPFFSASSGIWQTVWLEPVDVTSVEALKLVPDIDSGKLNIVVFGRGETNTTQVRAVALDNGKEVGRSTGSVGQSFQIGIPDPKLWSPDWPFLYDLKISLWQNEKEVDSVSSYFGMRKIAVANDKAGVPRLTLNNKPVFQLGTLDQGYWPDGIYTAPSDDALRYDIELSKQLGFNLCRKHVKIEPERWYYWCDKLGMLVWQDMPNGDRATLAHQQQIERNGESAADFEQEMRKMIVDRGNHPSIVMWIIFNQGWGQYDTTHLTAWVKELDPTRLVVGASGWNDLGTGDVRALHSYPGPALPLQDGRRACVLGECGGFGLRIPEHTWAGLSYWNLTLCHTPDELSAHYSALTDQIRNLALRSGLSGAVVTQFSDIETELDGFITYDREIIKIPVEKVRAANEAILSALRETANN